MPRYPWLYDTPINTGLTQRKLEVMRKLGVPYSDEEIRNATAALTAQAHEIADRLVQQGVAAKPELWNQEIIALTAYLQKLGRDIKN